MNYPKSLFYNFLTVYFANHLLPGIELLKMTKLPHIGSDLPFAVAVGLLNSLIYPVCKLIDQRTSMLRIAIVAVVLNFAIYATLKIAPIGIQVTSIKGYLLASSFVAIGSIVTNYLYMRSHRYHHHHHPKEHDLETPAHHPTKTDESNKPFS